MKDENITGSVQKPFWQRRRTKFLISAIMIVFLIVFAFEGILYCWSPNSDDNSVSFICTSSSGNNAFEVNAKINLTDGMDQNEAMKVADKVLLEITQQTGGQRLQLLFQNSSYDEEGIWRVEYTLGAHVYDASRTYGGSESTPHTLRTCVVEIDPFDLTVKYYG